MAEEYAISAANLHYIERELNFIHENLHSLDSDVDRVDGKVQAVYTELGSLAEEFHSFVMSQTMANRLGQAETRLVKIRQELEKKYGHYDLVRRTTTGILQANDLGIIRKETISTATEELMLSAPGYWLAPCLVALAAWINDRKELAEKAVQEAIRRDDEKASLFFALVCRRADRKQASLKWAQRYLENQDEENLNRETIIILDAYASGLLGSDSEGLISRQMSEWLEHLAEKPGFVEKQTTQWADAIKLKRKPLEVTSYTYLKQYSTTWPVLEDILQGANLHSEILDYFSKIFNQSASSDALKKQLDDTLQSLVTNYDEEELPLRKQEKLEQLVVDFGGDEARATKNMKIEETAFETNKDFTQLLTDAAMKPESSSASVSTQKFAIALSKEWITNAYNDVIAKNRMKIPNEIEIKIDNFHDRTADGSDENEMIEKFSRQVDQEKQEALSSVKLSGFDQYSLYAGIAIAVIGVLMLVTGSAFLGIIAIIVGIGMVISHNSKKNNVETARKNLNDKFEEKRTSGTQIIRASMAEVVDFRREFESKDRESQKVLDFLEQISPDQYVRKLADSSRRIRL